MLARIGRDLMRNGESLHILEVVDGRLVLVSAEWDVVGAWPTLACYQVDMPQPGLHRQRPGPPAGRLVLVLLTWESDPGRTP